MYEKVAWIVAGLFAGGAVLLSIRLIYSHLKHFTQPLIQSKVCIYSLFPCFLSFKRWVDRGDFVDGSDLRCRFMDISTIQGKKGR